MKLTTLFTTLTALTHAHAHGAPNHETSSTVEGPPTVRFLPSNFFTPGEKSTREYLPTFTTKTSTEAPDAVVTYAPPSPPGPTGSSDDEGDEGDNNEDDDDDDDADVEDGGERAWTDDPDSEMGFPFRGGVRTRVWDIE